MKKRIVIGLTAFAMIFFLGGIYIVFSVNKATKMLDRLILLHQVEILREHLMIEIKKVQADVNLKNTRYARTVDTFVNDVQQMDQVSQECFSCHHSEVVTARLQDMERQVGLYKNALSRVLTMRASDARLDEEDDNAYRVGEELVGKVNAMIALASSDLDKETRNSFSNIQNTRKVLYVLATLSPLLGFFLALVLIKGLTRPIKALLDATRKLKAGNLDHRIETLKDEFRELADSFNEMAGALTSQMKRVEESEIRYRTLFESAGDAIFIIEAEGRNAGRIAAANKAATVMHGYAVEELVGMSIVDLDDPNAAREVPYRIEKILGGECINEEIAHVRKDGTVFPVEISAALLELEGNKYVLAFDRDITRRKEVEGALRLSEEKFSKAFRASPDWITITTLDEGRYIEVNDAFMRISGYRREEVIGRTSGELGIWVDPKEREEMVPVLKKDGAVWNKEVHYRTKSGNVLTMLRSSQAIDYSGMRCIISVTHDITERRKTEIMLQRAEQMKAVAEVAVGLAHEIKNPLAGIKSSMEVLHAEGACSEEGSEILLKVITEIRRIEILLKDLLNFARPPKPELGVVDINPLLGATLELSVDKVRMASRPGIAVVREFEDGLPAVIADCMQMKQVFINLFLNAVEAMPDGGTLKIKTSYEKAASAVKIEISDTGKSIGGDTMDKIFQPFFTTKAKGTGMGLAISKRLIEDHGGTITLGNLPDSGAVFTIRLPVPQFIEVKA